MSELETHEALILEVIAIARRAKERRNRPFAAMLVSADGNVLAQAENQQITDAQVLAHAEMVLLHDAVQRFDSETLRGATIYTSAEPCAMCAGAIFWSGPRRLVFGISGERLHSLAGHTPDMLVTPSRAVLANAGRHVDIVGPVLEDEAATLFADGAP